MWTLRFLPWLHFNLGQPNQHPDGQIASQYYIAEHATAVHALEGFQKYFTDKETTSKVHQGLKKAFTDLLTNETTKSTFQEKQKKFQAGFEKICGLVHDVVAPANYAEALLILKAMLESPNQKLIASTAIITKMLIPESGSPPDEAIVKTLSTIAIACNIDSIVPYPTPEQVQLIERLMELTHSPTSSVPEQSTTEKNKAIEELLFKLGTLKQISGNTAARPTTIDSDGEGFVERKLSNLIGTSRSSRGNITRTPINMKEKSVDKTKDDAISRSPKFKEAPKRTDSLRKDKSSESNLKHKGSPKSISPDDRKLKKSTSTGRNSARISTPRAEKTPREKPKVGVVVSSKPSQIDSSDSHSASDEKPTVTDKLTELSKQEFNENDLHLDKKPDRASTGHFAQEEDIFGNDSIAKALRGLEGMNAAPSASGSESD